VADTVVFIPAWNEEENLRAVLEELRQELPEGDVLVVDDGSTDGTAEAARAAGAEVLSFGQNRGLRVGIAAGWRWAAEHGYAYAGRVDADRQHRVRAGQRRVELRGSKALKLVLTVGRDVGTGATGSTVRTRGDRPSIMITAATATTMIAPPRRIAGVTDSPSSSAPRRIATTGFTYA
jgi:glycosyltransferase involved in cell wall biosynthesis